jgi:branched-chain amino acid transport system substrate-binding protein
VFRICGRDDVQGSFAADYVVDHLRVDTIAIVHDHSAYGEGIADEFRTRLHQRGARETMYAAVDQGDKEFGDLIAKIIEGGIQTVAGTRRSQASLAWARYRGRPALP